MNHTEFYQEYMRRKEKAIELAILQYSSIDKRRVRVIFFPDNAFVGVYNSADEFVENIIIDGKDLDA